VLEPADDFDSWEHGGPICPECGSYEVYFDRIRPPGLPPYICDDCGCEGEEEKFKPIKGGE
jgi:hypothetical protein